LIFFIFFYQLIFFFLQFITHSM